MQQEGPISSSSPEVAGGLGVVSAPGQGIAGPRQASIQTHHDLQVDPGALVLAREQAGRVLPAPARQRHAVDDAQATARGLLDSVRHRTQDSGDDPSDHGHRPGDHGLGGAHDIGD